MVMCVKILQWIAWFFLYLMKKLLTTKISTFHLFFFVTMNILAFVIFTNRSYTIMVKHVLHAWISKMLIKERLQYKIGLYWNHAAFYILIHTITYQKLKIWIFIYHMFTFLVKITIQLNGMTCLWVNTISTTADAQMRTQKYIRF